nr:PKD domain-containing protein [Bacteroidota bacterium]
GSMNVSGYESDNVHLAFKYTSPDTESETWEIDDILVTAGGGTTPVITVISPAAGAIWIQENSYDILWSAFSTQTNVSIEVTENASSGTPTWTQLGTALATAGAWTWNVPLSQTPGNDYKIRISDFAADVTGESGIFSIIEPVYVPSLVITEIMYNPPESGTDSLEFIEIYNNDAIGVDMTDYSFANGVELVFPSLTLQPAEFLLVAVNSAAMQNTFGVDALQWTGGALSNNGELIELQDKYGNTVDYVLYDDALPWDTLADGFGPSLTFCDPSLDNSIPENWTTSILLAAINAAGDSIWATPGAGCASPEPVADFEADNTSIQAGQSVNFTDLSTGSPDTWQWTFEGGTPATYSGQTPPAITYNNQGTFDVSLTVTNQSGSSTETKVDYIQVFPTPPPPSANFTANVTIINVGQSVNFTDLSTNTPTSWEWTFEEGSPGTSTAQNPSGIVYNTAGTFDVTLTATNQYGSDTETKLDFITVQVIPPPQAAFGADATTIYVGESVVFTDQSTGGPTTWAWTFESGNPASSNQQNPPAISYNATGVYDVSLTVSNTNGSTTETKTDYINVIAVPTYDLVITEIMYNPPEAGDDFLEFIEIYNNSDDPANLGGLYFSAGIEFDFPAEVLQAGEYFLVAKDAAAFLTAFGVEAEQWTSGALSNSGELVEIMDVGSNIVDHVDYSDMAPWPVEPDGEGPSLTLCDPDIDNNNGENWYASVHYAGLNPAGDSLFATPGGPCQITAVDDLPNLQEISVFPNPSHGKFVVELPSHLEWNLEIYNLTGSIVFSTNSSDNRITVDVNHLKHGIYLLKATNYNGNNILSKKIIIE